MKPAWQAYCHGDPAFQRQVLVSNPSYMTACQSFKSNPEAQFYMTRVRADELRTILRSGVAGVFGHARITRRDSRFPRHCGFDFPAEGRMWIVYRRDWCGDAFLPDVDGRYRPGCLIVPQLPGDLPAIAPDEADATGMALWITWMESTGKSVKAVTRDTAISIHAVCALWGG
jgi:hypothetical protein